METTQDRLRDSSCYSRRRRNAPPQPDTSRLIETSERDIEVLTFIHRFGGMLTTDIIFRYCRYKGLYKNYASLSRRLKELYHEARLLDRPSGQRRVEHPDRYNLVHRVSECGEELLKARQLFSECVPRPYGAYEHQMMTACLYASYYIHALEAGLAFTPQHDLLKGKSKVAVKVDGEYVAPDALFMICMERKHVLIFLEADRATEPGHSSDYKRKSWGKTVEQYQKIIGQKLYMRHYDVPAACAAQVHVVTSHYSMRGKILRQVDRVFPQV